MKKLNYLMSALSPDSQRRILVTKELRHSMNSEITKVMQRNGANSVLHARYIRELGKSLCSSKDPVTLKYKPKLKIIDKDKAWDKALCLVVSYLRRYKMDSTLSSMRDEGATIPKDTGFQKASDVNNAFREFTSVYERLGAQTFRDRVEYFSQPSASKRSKPMPMKGRASRN